MRPRIKYLEKLPDMPSRFNLYGDLEARKTTKKSKGKYIAIEPNGFKKYSRNIWKKVKP